MIKIKFLVNFKKRINNFIDIDIEPNKKYHFRQFILRFIFLIKFHLKEKHLVRAASALSFDLLLAIIPIFFLGFALLNSFGAFEGGGASILKYIHENYFPIKTSSMDTLLSYLNKQNYSTMGSVGIITLIIFSTSLFLKIENVFNQLWSVTNKRHISKRFTNFFTFLMLAPIFFSMSLHFSSKFKTILDDLSTISAISAIFSYMVSGLFIFLMFFILYFFVPNTRVRFVPAVMGAIVASIIFMILKFVFGIYISNFVIHNYQNIFGTMTILPIFLIWIYLSWIITLIGGVISYIYNKYEMIWSFNKEFILNGKDKSTEVLTIEKLIEIFYIISERYSKGNGSTRLDQVSQYFRLQPQVISYIIEKWIESGLIISYEDGYLSYIPKKPLETIVISDIINPFLNDINLVDASKQFDLFINQYRTITKTFIEKKTIKDLI